jgi:hypothetical protein
MSIHDFATIVRPFQFIDRGQARKALAKFWPEINFSEGCGIGNLWVGVGVNERGWWVVGSGMVVEF